MSFRSFNPIFGIIEGLKHIKKCSIKSIDVIDRDVYGRESLITIELCCKKIKFI